jgi:hypothetical protein
MVKVSCQIKCFESSNGILGNLLQLKLNQILYNPQISIHIFRIEITIKLPKKTNCYGQRFYPSRCVLPF